MVEDAAAVAEVHLGGGDGGDSAGARIISFDVCENLAHFLAVGADVLDGGGTKCARDGAEGLHAGIA